MEELDIQQMIEKEKLNIVEKDKKQEVTKDFTSHEIAEIEKKAKSVFDLVDEKESALLKTDAVQGLSQTVAEEKIKANLAEEAAKIGAKNQEIAEKRFDTETKELRLKQLKEALALQHAYEMKTIRANEKHRIMLDKRQKLVEKYGYLYEQQTYEDVDSNGHKVLKSRPKNFSYSIVGNKIRTFTRNLQALDTTIRKILKWGFFGGIALIIIVVLKRYGIII